MKGSITEDDRDSESLKNGLPRWRNRVAMRRPLYGEGLILLAGLAGLQLESCLKESHFLKVSPQKLVRSWLALRFG